MRRLAAGMFTHIGVHEHKRTAAATIRGPPPGLNGPWGALSDIIP